MGASDLKPDIGDVNKNRKPWIEDAWFLNSVQRCHLEEEEKPSPEEIIGAQKVALPTQAVTRGRSLLFINRDGHNRYTSTHSPLKIICATIDCL